MSRRVWIVAVVMMLLGACSQADEAEPSTGTSEGVEGVTVSGTGEVTGKPDTLTVAFRADVVRPTVDEAIAASNQAAQVTVDVLEASGVDPAQIQTQNYSINANFRWDEDGNQIDDGFRVVNNIKAETTDLDGAGELIDEVVSSSEDVFVDGVWFSLEEDDPLVEEARAQAWEDARGKAEQLAELAGLELGPAVQVDESYGGFEALYSADEFAATADTDASLQPGELTTGVTVNVRFALVNEGSS